MIKRVNPGNRHNGLRKGIVFIVLLAAIAASAVTTAGAADSAGVITLKSVSNLTTGESTPYAGETIGIAVNGKDTAAEITIETSNDIDAVNLELLTADWGRLLLAPMAYDGKIGLFKLIVTMPANIRSGDYYLSFVGNPGDEMAYLMNYNQPAPLTVKNNDQIMDIPEVSLTYEPETPEPEETLYLYFAAQSPYGIASVDYRAYFPSREWAVLSVADYNAETGLWESKLAIADFELETGDYILITCGATDRLGNAAVRTGEQLYAIPIK